MQSIVPVGDRNPNGHDRTAILSALHATENGARYLTFRYEVWDKLGRLKLAHLDGVESCVIEQNWLAPIKRTARFRIRDLGKIDFLSDRIRPYVRLHIPPYGDLDWVEWPQGHFLLASPNRTVDQNRTVTRPIEAYDRTYALEDDKPGNRVKVAASTDLLDAVYAQLGYLSSQGFRPPGSVLRPVAREWDPGTSRLKIVNDLLGMINYQSISYDEQGREVVRPYESPDKRAEEYVYEDGANGLVIPEVDQILDLFGVPNEWTLIMSEPDRPLLVSSYVNMNPASPTSVVRRGRTISDVRTETDVTDQAALDAKVARLAFEASQVFEAVDFETAIVPFHSGNDVYRIRYSPLGIDAKYVEQSWSMELRAGARMRHRARRVVTV